MKKDFNSSQSQVKYGLDLGKIIYDYIDQHTKYNFSDVAKILNLSRGGLKHKLLNAHYGTTYDLIEISLALEKDFVSLLSTALKVKNVNVERLHSDKEFTELKNRIKELEEQLSDRKREIDLLYNTVKK